MVSFGKAPFTPAGWQTTFKIGCSRSCVDVNKHSRQVTLLLMPMVHRHKLSVLINQIFERRANKSLSCMLIQLLSVRTRLFFKHNLWRTSCCYNISSHHAEDISHTCIKFRRTDVKSVSACGDRWMLARASVTSNAYVINGLKSEKRIIDN